MSRHVLLVFPPVWLPEAPFLSTAILTAYLRERGVPVDQRDLNVELWRRFEEPGEIRRIHQRALARWERILAGEDGDSHQVGIVNRLAPVVGLSEDRFCFEVAKGIVSREEYRRVVQSVSELNLYEAGILDGSSRGPEDRVQQYHDLLYSDISCSLFARSSESLSAILRPSHPNPYRTYFERCVLPGIEADPPAVFGLSIAAVNQVVPAFTLAQFVKERCGSHVVIGGSWCTHVHTRLAGALQRFPFIDSMVIYEGEEPLYRLWTALSDGATAADLGGIPNLYVNGPGGIEPPRGRFSANMGRLPTPDFEGLPLGSYDRPGTLTIQASRGCYWGRCTFCSYPLLEPEYKARSPERLVRDFERLHARFGLEEVGFTDALISPSFARKLSRELLSSDLELGWNLFARLEKAFTAELLELMARAGCSMVSWGLESGDPRILDLIEKSIDLDHARGLLADSAAAGIHNRVLVMYGHPTERYDQALATVKFLEENLEHIHSISHNFYHPEMNTPIEALAERLGIALEASSEDDLALGYAWASSMSPEELRDVKGRFEAISQELSRRSERAPAAEGRPLLEPDAPHSFRVDLQEAVAGGRNVLSTLVEERGLLRRRSFEVTEY